MWNLNDVSVGDLVQVEVVNPLGDRNLDGARITGIVTELVPSHNMARLDSGWCVHTKDNLIFHRKPEAVKVVKVPECDHDFSEGQCIYCRVHGS